MILTKPIYPVRSPRDAQYRWLEVLVERYHRPEFIAPDPLQCVRRYDDPADLEIVGLIAASLAYGNVKSILQGIEQVEHRIGPAPSQWLADTRPTAIRRALANFRYRVTAGHTMAGLLVGVRKVIAEYGSLGAALEADLQRTRHDMLEALDRWVDRIEQHAGVSLDHLLARPSRGSACKRLFLYLRWMVRQDAIDPGGWSIDPALLVAPIDTHMHLMATRLGWTRRKQANLATALEVTAALRRHAPHDPLRYDFALTRPGIRRESFDLPR